jgi:hypothetical protein
LVSTAILIFVFGFFCLHACSFVFFVGGAIVFHKDIKPAKLGDQPVGLVTTQAYFNPREKNNPDGSLKSIKEGEEFVVMQV